MWVDAGEAKEAGAVVVANNLTGVALLKTDSDNKTTIDTQGVYKLSVVANDGSASAVAIGQVIFAASTGVLSKIASGVIFGIALEAITSGATAEIMVLQAKGNLTQLVNNAIGSAQMNPQYMKVATSALTAGAENAFAFAWQNPHDAAILVHRVIVDVTAEGDTSSTLDVGTAATATTNGDNFLDGVDITSAGIFDNITAAASARKMDEKDGTTDYITGQILAGNAATLAGFVYIYYTQVQSA